MTDKAKQQPKLGAGGAEAAAERQQRLAAALRANLARRKAQARTRDARSAGGPQAEEGGTATNFVTAPLAKER